MKKRKPLTVNLERVPGDGPRPLRVKIDILIPANDPRQETVWEPFGALVAAMLEPGEAAELLRQFEEKYPAASRKGDR